MYRYNAGMVKLILLSFWFFISCSTRTAEYYIIGKYNVTSDCSDENKSGEITLYTSTIVGGEPFGFPSDYVQTNYEKASKEYPILIKLLSCEDCMEKYCSTPSKIRT